MMTGFGNSRSRCGLLLLLCLLVFEVRAEWITCNDTAMTTRIEAVFWHGDTVKGEALCQQVMAEFHRIEGVMSTYREDTELAKVNRLAAQEAVAVSDEVMSVLLSSYRISELSGGAFDMTFSSAGVLYDYRSGRRPTDEALTDAIKAIDYRYVELAPKKHQVRFKHSGVRLDLGGIAKGYSVDRAIDLLKAAGVQSARVSAGGDMFLLGSKLGKPWIVGVRDPRGATASENAVVLPLSDVAVSTSGDYERFFIEDGERVHHILSPGSGKPAKGLQSVTILGPDTTTTDGLSTAVFVLGLEKGLALINRLPGIDAILIDEQRKMHYSADLTPP